MEYNLGFIIPPPWPGFEKGAFRSHFREKKTKVEES